MESTAKVVMLKGEPFFADGTRALPKIDPRLEESVNPRRRRGGFKKAGRFALIFSLLCLLGAGGFSYVQWSSQFESTDDAYVSGDIHPISPRMAGTIAKVFVQDNQYVHEGDLLVQLDDRDEKTALEQARAKLREAKAQVESVRAEISEAEAKVAEAQAQLTKADADYRRAQELQKTRVISKAEYDTATAAYSSAKAATAGTHSALEAVKAKQSLAEAQVNTASTAVDAAELQLSYTKVTAPSTGRLGKKNAQEGQQVQPGEPLFAIVEDHSWVNANFKETQLAKMKPGQKVDVEIDALPHSHFEGVVDSLSPGSGAQFALLPPDNATGNFTKIVQRVPVKVVLTKDSIRGFEDRIVPGLSALVRVHVSHQ